MAFLVVLESLSPIERAAYLLRRVFDHGYDEIAAILEVSRQGCNDQRVVVHDEDPAAVDRRRGWRKRLRPASIGDDRVFRQHDRETRAEPGFRGDEYPHAEQLGVAACDRKPEPEAVVGAIGAPPASRRHAL